MSTTAQEELDWLDIARYLESTTQDTPPAEPVFDIPNPDLSHLDLKSDRNSIDYGQFLNFEDETLWLPEPERKPKSRARASPPDVDMEMLEAEASSELAADTSGGLPKGDDSMTSLLESSDTPEDMDFSWLMDPDMNTTEMPAGETEPGAAR